MRRLSPAAALRGAVLAAASGAGCALFGLRSGPPAVPPLQPLCFFAIADWGGEQLPPYTTPGQLAVASTMGTVAASAGSHPAFVLAAGDNFYMDGLAGAHALAALAAALLGNLACGYRASRGGVTRVEACARPAHALLRDAPRELTRVCLARRARAELALLPTQPHCLQPRRPRACARPFKTCTPRLACKYRGT